MSDLTACQEIAVLRQELERIRGQVAQLNDDVSTWTLAVNERDAEIKKLRAAFCGSCGNCRHYSAGCGSSDKDGICKHPGFPKPTRQGVAAYVWRHVCRTDCCLSYEAARAAGGGRVSKYANDQHELICDLLGVSPSPDEPGDTAFEAVVRLQAEIERLQAKLALWQEIAAKIETARRAAGEGE